MMRKTLLSILLTTLLSPALLSQDALEIVRPVAPDRYPPAAHAVRASGEVRVEVKIDRTGHVVSGEILSGHPLLKAVSLETAKKWEFSHSKGSNLRTANLFFNFVGTNEYRMVESAEKEEVLSVQTSFPSPYVVEIVSEILRPRLLLLPRKDGKVIPRFCSLHQGVSMLEEVQKRCQGDREKTGVKNLIFLSDAYGDAESSLFPWANTVDWYTLCGNGEIEAAEVQYCPECRMKRESWLSEKDN